MKENYFLYILLTRLAIIYLAKLLYNIYILADTSLQASRGTQRWEGGKGGKSRLIQHLTFPGHKRSFL